MVYFHDRKLLRQFECPDEIGMYREPVNDTAMNNKLLDTIFLKNLLEVTVYFHDRKLLRQFECPDEIGMYREPVNDTAHE